MKEPVRAVVGQQMLGSQAPAACAEHCFCGYFGTPRECPAVAPKDVLSGDSPDVGSALAELGGLDLGATTMAPQRQIDLPNVLVQVDGTAACRGLVRPVMATTIGTMMARAGARARDDRDLAERLGLPAGTSVGLLLFAHDQDLEVIWAHRQQWLPTISRWTPTFVTTPDFSVWAGDHGLATRYNIVRSVRLVTKLQALGLTVIPHLFWADARDLRDCEAWIEDNRPEVIALDLQCSAGELRQIVHDLRSLRERLTTPPRLLVNGIDIGARLASVLAAWPELTITRNYIPEVAKHVDVLERRDGSLARVTSNDPPAVILERRVALAERWLARRGGAGREAA